MENGNADGKWQYLATLIHPLANPSLRPMEKMWVPAFVV